LICASVGRRSRPGTAILHGALTDKLKEKTLGQIYAERGIALAIAAVERSQHRGWVFKTPHLKGTNHRDDYWSMCALRSRPHRSTAPWPRSTIRMVAAGSTCSWTAVSGEQSGLGRPDRCARFGRPGQGIQGFLLGSCPMPAGEEIAKNARGPRLAAMEVRG
jgi:hypothetical protein